jgi:hypothetical protein
MMTDLALRVFVLDAWDDIGMRLPVLTAIADVKRQALASARITGDPAAYLVKFRGAEVRDESRSLEDERVPSGGSLIVMRRRRVPVR